MEIIGVHPLFKNNKVSNKNFSNIGPCEFLWLIRNASFICTDSFHATAMGSIYNKKIITNIPPKENGRVYDLISKIGIESKTIIVEGNEINYYELISDLKLKTEREKSLAYLFDSIKNIL